METNLEPKDHPDPLIEAKQKKLVKWKRRCGRIVGNTDISAAARNFCIAGHSANINPVARLFVGPRDK
jgi:hypothetical protein